ncbi:MAG: beta strand repeat-containing protein [Burkholderiaceae bacterium]
MAQTITTAQQTALSQLYVAFFNRAADSTGLGHWADDLLAGKSIENIAQSFYNTDAARPYYSNGQTADQFIETFYSTVLGRAADTEGKAYWVAQLKTPGQTQGSVAVAIVNAVTAYAGTDAAALTSKALFNAKVLVSTEYALHGGTDAGAANVLSGVVDAATAAAAITKLGSGVAGSTFTLTTGADTLVGTAGNDTFSAVEVAGSTVALNTLSVGDSVDAGAGNDTLNITQTAAFAMPLSTTVKNVETVNLISGTTASNINTTSWTGVTALNVTAPGDVTATAAATTAIAVTDATLAAQAITVNGGSTVTVTATDATATAGTIVVGGTAAAAGAVTVTTNSSLVDVATTATTGAGDAVTVTGGTAVTVTQNLTVSGGSNDATDALTGGVITVNGNASTTAVTVNQTAAAARVATAAGVVGSAAIVDGQVVIADVNAATATADTIATVTLNGYGTGSTIASDALTTLNLSRTGGTLSVNGGAADATQVATTLALNVNGLTGAAISLSTPYTTLNLASATTASTIANVTAAGVTTLNVSGDAAVTLTNNTFGALTSVVSTNTAGVTLGTTALGPNVAFTGGAGNDSIILSNAFTKAITMGDGNDSVGYGGAASVVAGLVGSVAAGNGTDTIRMTAGQADTADGTAAFNTAFTGFEVLDITATTANVTVNLAGINGVNSVVARGIGAGNALTLNGFATNGTLTLDTVAAGATSAYAVNLNNAVLTAGDVFNVVLSNANAAANFGTVTAAGVETINISTVDAGATTALRAATLDSVTLGENAQGTTLVVSGNNGLIITNDAGNTAITSFNASGVVANDAATVDTAANLAVTFVSNNATVTAAVSITGGAGNDTLTGNAAIDTITGGAGNDNVTGGLGADIINVGTGHDVINIASIIGTSSDSSTAAADTINGYVLSSAITAADLTTGGAAVAFQASIAGGANLSLLSLNLTAAASADQAITVEANATALVGQAAGVTYTVTSGILTLAGAGAAAVDTLGEWLVEAQAVAATAGDILAFQFGGNTYVYAENGAQDVLINLAGVTGATSLVEITGSTTAAAGSILFADIA